MLAAALAAGCARFQPEPLSPAQKAEELEGRTLTNATLQSFLERNLQRELAGWPPTPWDFDMLTLAAFYYHPSLEVARAQWVVAQGGETTAGQQPNPVLNVTPGYNATTLTPSPWLPLGWLDITVETAGKRRHRRARAAQLSEAARLNIATVAWQVRGRLRTALLDWDTTRQREALLRSQVALQEQIVHRLDQQVQAGAIAGSEAAVFRVALAKAQVDLLDIRRQHSEARSRVAEALGVPHRALDEVRLAFDPPQDAAVAELVSSEIRRRALQNRADILAGLVEYGAAQSALQIEIAKQYPDIHLQPGYQFDQGDSKWSLGLTIELPILHHNQGPIAEAQARRREAAARFNEVQSRVLADIERAVQGLEITRENSSALTTLAQAQAQRRDAVAAQVAAGAAEPLELISARSEYVSAELALLDGRARLQQAMGALEDALQQPVFGHAPTPPSPTTYVTDLPAHAAK